METVFHFQNIVREGYLIKSPPLHLITSPLKKWQKRWLVLVNRTFDTSDSDPMKLYYFKDKTSYEKRDSPKGCISLTSKTTEIRKYEGPFRGHGNLIMIVRPKRTFYLSAASEEDQNCWFQALKFHQDGDHTIFMQNDKQKESDTNDASTEETVISRGQTDLERKIAELKCKRECKKSLKCFQEGPENIHRNRESCPSEPYGYRDCYPSTDSRGRLSNLSGYESCYSETSDRFSRESFPDFPEDLDDNRGSFLSNNSNNRSSYESTCTNTSGRSSGFAEFEDQFWHSERLDMLSRNNFDVNDEAFYNNRESCSSTATNECLSFSNKTSLFSDINNGIHESRDTNTQCTNHYGSTEELAFTEPASPSLDAPCKSRSQSMVDIRNIFENIDLSKPEHWRRRTGRSHRSQINSDSLIFRRETPIIPEEYEDIVAQLELKKNC